LETLGTAFIGGATAKDLDTLAQRMMNRFTEATTVTTDEGKVKSLYKKLLEDWKKVTDLAPPKLRFNLPTLEELGFKFDDPARKAGEEAGKAMGQGIATEAQTAIDAMKINPVRVPITFGVVPAIEVGTLEHLQLLSGLPVGPQMEAAASQNVRARREAIEAARAARKAEAATFGGIFKPGEDRFGKGLTPAQSLVAGRAAGPAEAFVARQAQGAKDVGPRIAKNTEGMIAFLKQIAENTFPGNTPTVEIENADLE
jgi:hypothetical protein